MKHPARNKPAPASGTPSGLAMGSVMREKGYSTLWGRVVIPVAITE